ncbi:MAG: hypothetical protein HYZ12_00615 [Thaumarchaeota archaeon]|nr:hypothetical protein [Nitrososphaerota archaeon]
MTKRTSANGPTRRRTLGKAAIAGIVIVIVFVALVFYMSIPSSVTYQAGKSFSTPEDVAVEMTHALTSAGTIMPSNNTIFFHSKEVKIVVLATMRMALPEFNISMSSVPSYVGEKAPVFIVYGLVEPTISVPNGAKINLTIINADDDMAHNFVIAKSGPPFSTSFSSDYFETNMEFLQPATEQGMNGYWYTFTLPSGSYWYLCEVPGHASQGMYGKIIST